MADERKPISLSDGWNTYAPPDSDPYIPVDNESWETLADLPAPKSLGLNDDDLCYFNFGTRNHEEINWYLHFKVGCTISPDKYNYRFSTADHTPILKTDDDGKPLFGDDGQPVILGYETDEGGRSHVYLPRLSAKLLVHEYPGRTPDVDIRLSCPMCLTYDQMGQLYDFFRDPPPPDKDMQDFWRRGAAAAPKKDYVKDAFSRIDNFRTIMGWKITPDPKNRGIKLECQFDEVETIDKVLKWLSR